MGSEEAPTSLLWACYKQMRAGGILIYESVRAYPRGDLCSFELLLGFDDVSAQQELLFHLYWPVSVALSGLQILL